MRKGLLFLFLGLALASSFVGCQEKESDIDKVKSGYRMMRP